MARQVSNLGEFSHQRRRKYGIETNLPSLRSDMLGYETHQPIALYNQLPIAPYDHPLTSEPEKEEKKRDAMWTPRFQAHAIPSRV